MSEERRHRVTTHGLSVAIGALALGLGAAPAAAQIPDEYTNLQILPKDVGREQLVNTMVHFAGSLGVRCNHCHVGGDDLEGMDFATDQKLAKRQARYMMRMVESLNRELAKLPGERPPAEARCNTCHHGVLRPVMLEVVLDEVAAEAGMDTALARYDELREQYYGRGAYDFGERSLIRLARLLGARGRTRDAVVVLERNVALFPDSAVAYASLGEGQMSAGDPAAAVASYRRALELGPDEAFIRKRLSEAEEAAARR